jgi:hypothetical protein
MTEWYARWSRTSQRDTSRSAFGALCDALYSRSDLLSAGPPQLVGLYRIGNGRTFGIIHGTQRYLYGLPVIGGTLLHSVEWRNCLFERCDPVTLSRQRDAQPQPAPRGLGRAGSNQSRAG